MSDFEPELHLEEYAEYKKKQLELGSFPVIEKHKMKHAKFMKKMTTPVNPANDLLHEHWQPWAEKYSYLGVGDVMAMARESRDLRSRSDEEDSDDDDGPECCLMIRWRLIESHGYAIPNEIALNKIASLGPVLEIGSGSGYWVDLLRKKGADVIAVDDKSDGFKKFWIDDTIFMDGVCYLMQHDGCPDRTLLLCWSRYGHDMVQAFKGDHLVIVGEPVRGCTCACTWGIDEDDEEFAGWELTEICAIPTWPGMRDDLRIYRRRADQTPDENTEITKDLDKMHISSGTQTSPGTDLSTSAGSSEKHDKAAESN